MSAARDESRKRVLGGSLNLPAVLTQLRRNVVELQRVVDLLLGRCGDDCVVFEAKQSVLRERKAALDGPLTQRHVVMFGSGEVLQRSAVAGAWQQPHVHLQVVAQREADLVLSLGEQFVDERKRSHVLDRRCDNLRLAGRSGDEQVKVANRLTAASQAARGRNRLNARKLADQRPDAVGVFFRNINAEARGIFAVVLDALDQLVGEALTHARQREQVAALGSLFERIDVGDAESRVEHRNGLRAHAGKAKELEHRRLVSGQEFIPQRHGASGCEVADIRGHALANARNRQQRLGVRLG